MVIGQVQTSAAIKLCCPTGSTVVTPRDRPQCRGKALRARRRGSHVEG